MTAINIATFTNSISDRQLEQLCADNPETKFETTSEGKLIIMSPTGSESGRKNGRLFFQVELWNTKTKLGVSFDSSTGFKLSNGATRSPDVSWIKLDRWRAIPKDQKRRFAPIDPDFVVELASPTDDLDELRKKMQEYMNCGVQLGWLICPDQKQVEIYRQGKETELLDNPSELSEKVIMPGLKVDLTDIFAD